MQQKKIKEETKQFSHREIIPESVHNAITLFTSHTHQMIIAYHKLCHATKQNRKNNIVKSDEFEIEIKNAFDGINSITSIGFIEYAEKYILETTDNLGNGFFNFQLDE